MEKLLPILPIFDTSCFVFYRVTSCLMQVFFYTVYTSFSFYVFPGLLEPVL